MREYVSEAISSEPHYQSRERSCTAVRIRRHRQCAKHELMPSGKETWGTILAVTTKASWWDMGFLEKEDLSIMRSEMSWFHNQQLSDLHGVWRIDEMEFRQCIQKQSWLLAFCGKVWSTRRALFLFSSICSRPHWFTIIGNIPIVRNGWYYLY